LYCCLDCLELVKIVYGKSEDTKETLGKIVMILYKFITSFFYFILYPLWYLIFYSKNFRQRVSLKNLHYLRECIWIHAASVGEVNAVKPLIKKLLEQYNTKAFVLTSVTEQGIKTGKEISGKLIVHQFPLDISHLMKRFFKMLRPRLIILVETELWPIMLHQAYTSDVPVIMINARLSQKSFRRYRHFRWFFRKGFSSIKLVCAQSMEDVALFSQLHFPNVVNTSNLKFALELPKHEIHVLRKAWGYNFNDFVVSFGCTRPGEEQIFKDVYDRLKDKIPRLKIIIAPRHLPRLTDVKALFRRGEYSLFTISDTRKPVLIVDELGVLPQMYALSDIAVIGGSFINFGGHNPLEAVWYERPVIMGEYFQSCAVTINKLLAEHGIIISSPERLYDDILRLHNDLEFRKELGQRAKKILLDNQDAINLHWEEIVKWIEIVK